MIRQLGFLIAVLFGLGLSGSAYAQSGCPGSNCPSPTVQNFTIQGNLTASALPTTGTATGSLCQSSGGIINATGANCFGGGGSVSITGGDASIVVSPSPLTGTGTVTVGGPSHLTTFTAGTLPMGAGASPFTASEITDVGQAGVVVGSPSGGAKGAGTINMTGCFINNVACASGSSPSFSAITGGTNTSAAMVIGSGASLGVSGSGTNAATSVPAAGVATGAFANGMTATTQTTGDNTTKLATDAFVLANGSGFSSTLNQITSGTSNTLASVTTPFTTEVWLSATASAKTDNIPACASGINKDYLIEVDGQQTAGAFPITVTPASGTIGPAGTASYTIPSNAASVVFQCDSTSTTWRLVASSYPGTAIRYATATTLTVGANDNGNEISQSNAASVAATIAQAGTTGFPEGGFQTIIHNTGAGTITLTPTTSTINGGANITIAQNAGALIFADLVGNYDAVPLGGSGGGSSAFSSLTSGTNTTAAMIVGSGAQIGFTGSGTVAATSAPVGGITGLGTGVATWLATPSSANLAAAVTGETGTGALVFGTAPALSSPTVTTAFTATGLVTNADLVNASTAVNGVTCTLGSTCSPPGSVGATTAGTANAQTLAKAGYTLTDQSHVDFKVGAGLTNTTAAPTLNVNSTGATAMDIQTGGALVSLPQGFLVAGLQYSATFQSSCTCFVVMTTPQGGVTVATTNQAPSSSQWAIGQGYVSNAASLTYTPVVSTTLSPNGFIVINSVKAGTLTATSPDTITTSEGTTGAGGSVTLAAGTITLVSTDGAGHLYAAGNTAGSATASNCSSGASPAVCAAARAGSVAVPTGVNPTLVVNTTAVTAASEVLLTIDESATISATTCNTTLATLIQPVVTARTAGTSFTIQVPATLATNPACVNYLIIN